MSEQGRVQSPPFTKSATHPLKDVWMQTNPTNGTPKNVYKNIYILRVRKIPHLSK